MMNLEYIREGVRNKGLILLCGNEPNVVRTICAEFYALAKGSRTSLSLDEIPGIKSIEDCRVLAVVESRDQGITHTQDGNSFKWALSQSSWDNVAGLVEPFSEGPPRASGDVRFQWLDELGDVPLIISTERSW